MTSENTDIEAVDPDARRDLLSQQFDDAAAAAPDVPAPAGPVARTQDGQKSRCGNALLRRGRKTTTKPGTP